MNGLVQGSDDVSCYYTKLKMLWDELKDFRPIPTCTCGGMKALIEYQQHAYVMQFLMGLNESYTQIQTQILMQDPPPSINKVFSLVVQDERQRSLTHLNYDSVTCNATSSSYGQHLGSYKGRFEKPVCSHYGIQGQVVDKCYKPYGYLPGFKFKLRAYFTKTNKPVVNQAGVNSDQFDDAFQKISLVTIVVIIPLFFPQVNANNSFLF